MKKTLLRLLLGVLTGLIIFSTLSLVSADSGLCRGVNGYYGDCSYEPWAYQADKDTSRSSVASPSSSFSSSSNVFKGANAEVYQFNSATRNSKPANYASYYSPNYYSGYGSGYGYGGFANGAYGYGLGYGGYDNYGYGDYGLGYDSGYGYDYSGYGGYANGGYGNSYPGYGYGNYGYGNAYGGYGYPNALDYGLGIGAQYATPEGRQWLGVASMIQQFFWM